MKKILITICALFFAHGVSYAQWKPAGEKIKTHWAEKVTPEHVLPDVEIEVNGLMTYDRKVIKLDEKRLKEINEKICKALEK